MSRQFTLILIFLMSITAQAYPQKLGPKSPEIRKRIEQFQDARAKYIQEKASLTTEEMAFVKTELQSSDSQRVKFLMEQLRIAKEISEGNTLDDAEYASRMVRLLQIDEEIAKLNSDLFSRLGTKLSNEKLCKVYIGIKRFQYRFAKTYHKKKELQD